MVDEESATFGTLFPGRAYSREIHRNGALAEPATVEHAAWEEHTYIYPSPTIPNVDRIQ